MHGNLPNDRGVIEAPIGRSDKDRKKQAVTAKGKPAVTRFTVLERFGNYTLVELQLETGRTHQIRVHMAYIGHPVEMCIRDRVINYEMLSWFPC